MDKDSKTFSDAAKRRRHVHVVGGTSTAPSLREVAHHRNIQRKNVPVPRSQSTPATSTKVTARDKKSMLINEDQQKTSCNLCSKVQRQWNQSGGLRKKTRFSDVTVHSSDGEYFYCNSFVLALWSKSLLEGARCAKAGDQEEWIVNVDVFSGEVLQWCLYMMHGGPLEDLPPKHLSDMIKMAEMYLMNDVKRLCLMAANIIPLKVENVCAMWLFASEYNLPKAVDRAMRFVYMNLEKVTRDRDWPRISQRPEMLLNLFKDSVTWTMPIDWRSATKEEKQRFALSTGVQSIWRESGQLRRPYAHSDVMIKTKGGGMFHVHTQIIYATSPSFAAFLLDECEATDSAEVVMDDFDDDVVEEFLRFMYQQEPSVSFPELAPMVTILAIDYGVVQLERECEREMASKELKTVDKAFDMLRDAEEHRLPMAKSICFRYLYSNLEAARQHEEWHRIIKEEPQLLTEMMLESKRFRRVVSESEAQAVSE